MLHGCWGRLPSKASGPHPPVAKANQSPRAKLETDDGETGAALIATRLRGCPVPKRFPDLIRLDEVKTPRRFKSEVQQGSIDGMAE
jgi:hypothetical protein